MSDQSTQDQLTQEQAEALWNEMDKGEAKPADPDPQPKEEPKKEEPAAQGDAAKAAPEEASADDPYAGFSEAARNEIIGLKTMLTSLSSRVRNTEGHIGGMKSQLEAAKEVRAAGGAAPSASELKDAQGKPGAIERMKQDYPEFAEAMEALADAKAEQRFAALREQVQPGIKPEELAALKAEIERDIRVDLAHPGWKDRIKTAEFVGWYTRQDSNVRSLGASQRPEDAIDLLNRFETASKPKPTNKRLESAAALPSGRPQASRNKPVEEMTREELWKHFDAQEGYSK